MICKNCGRNIDDNARFCDYCGANIMAEQPVRKKANTRNNVLLVIVVILLLVIVALVLFIVSKKNNSNNNNNDDSHSDTAVVSETETETEEQEITTSESPEEETDATPTQTTTSEQTTTTTTTTTTTQIIKIPVITDLYTENTQLYQGVRIDLFVKGDFQSIGVKYVYPFSSDSTYSTYSYSEASNGFQVYVGSDMLLPTLYITPYGENNSVCETTTFIIPEPVYNTPSAITESVYRTGEISAVGNEVAGFTTEYVYGGPCGYVRKVLPGGWHVTAKNKYYNYNITWYELWDTDDGDYYGWVDANYIYFYN